MHTLRRRNALDRFLRDMIPNIGRTLVTGSCVYDDKLDRRALYAGEVMGIDMQAGPGVDLVHDLETPLPDGWAVTHVDCVSTLEHVRRPWLFAQTLEAAMEPGATILVSVPWVWRVHGYPDDYWRFTPSAIRTLFPSCEWVKFYYMSDNRLARAAPKQVDRNGTVWYARTELIGWGVRCAF